MLTTCRGKQVYQVLMESVVYVQCSIGAQHMLTMCSAAALLLLLLRRTTLRRLLPIVSIIRAHAGHMLSIHQVLQSARLLRLLRKRERKLVGRASP